MNIQPKSCFLGLCLLGNARLFTKFLFNFRALAPPPPKTRSDGFRLEFLLEGPQTELRTLSQNCEQTLQKLRTNRIMNKRAFLNQTLVRTGVLFSPSNPQNCRKNRKSWKRTLHFCAKSWYAPNPGSKEIRSFPGPFRRRGDPTSESLSKRR